MRYLLFILLLVASAFGLDYDLDSDLRVDFVDFATLAAGYGSTYDMNDVNGLADEWLSGTYIPTKPTADDVNVFIFTRTIEAITLVATDDGWPTSPSKLKYIITSLPADGDLQDPASGAGYITKVPHTLSGNGNIVWYSTDANGTKAFNYKVNDYGTSPTGGDSNSATVTIDVNNHPTTQLSFNAGGYVEVDDDPNLEFKDGTIIAFFLLTRQPFVDIMSKRDSNAQGYEIKLVSGKPWIGLYDANGTLTFSYKSPHRVNTGIWKQVSIQSPNDANYIEIYIDDINVDTDGYQITGSEANLINFNFENDANLIIGPDYNWQLDNLRLYQGYSQSQVLLGPSFEGSYREGTTPAGEGGFFMRPADVRWLCDEGSGSTITDDKDGGIVGSFSDTNDVNFVPLRYMFNDTSVQQFYRRNR